MSDKKNNTNIELIVQVAEMTVLQLARDWQQNPWYWYQEFDIHAELRGRLNTVFSLLGLAECYTDNRATPAVSYSRVQCAPNFKIESKGISVKPDIVVWGEAPDSQRWKEWPVIWACEIKYDSTPNDEDVDKLRKLLDAGLIQRGCSLIFENAEKGDEPKLVWENAEKTLNTCRVRAPRKISSN